MSAAHPAPDGPENVPHDASDHAADTPATGAPAPRKSGKKPAPRSARRRSREFALQGLYQWLLSGDSAKVVEALNELDLVCSATPSGGGPEIPYHQVEIGKRKPLPFSGVGKVRRRSFDA